MADLASVAKRIVEEGLAGKDDTFVAHLAEEAVLNIPMQGEIQREERDHHGHGLTASASNASRHHHR